MKYTINKELILEGQWSPKQSNTFLRRSDRIKQASNIKAITNGASAAGAGILSVPIITSIAGGVLGNELDDDGMAGGLLGSGAGLAAGSVIANNAAIPAITKAAVSAGQINNTNVNNNVDARLQKHGIFTQKG